MTERQRQQLLAGHQADFQQLRAAWSKRCVRVNRFIMRLSIDEMDDRTNLDEVVGGYLLPPWAGEKDDPGKLVAYHFNDGRCATGSAFTYGIQTFSKADRASCESFSALVESSTVRAKQFLALEGLLTALAPREFWKFEEGLEWETLLFRFGFGRERLSRSAFLEVNCFPVPDVSYEVRLDEEGRFEPIREDLRRRRETGIERCDRRMLRLVDPINSWGAEIDDAVAASVRCCDWILDSIADLLSDKPLRPNAAALETKGATESAALLRVAKESSIILSKALKMRDAIVERGPLTGPQLMALDGMNLTNVSAFYSRYAKLLCDHLGIVRTEDGYAAGRESPNGFPQS